MCITHDIGQTSIAIFCSRQISINLGCLVSEKLGKCIKSASFLRTYHITNPCPIRFVPSRIASYKFMSAAVPSPRVSPAWKRKGMSGCCSAKRRRGSAYSISGFDCSPSSWPTRSNPGRWELLELDPPIRIKPWNLPAMRSGNSCLNLAH